MVQPDKLEPSFRFSRPSIAFRRSQGWFLADDGLSICLCTSHFVFISKTLRYLVRLAIVLVDSNTTRNGAVMGAGFEVIKPMRFCVAKLESLDHARVQYSAMTIALTLMNEKIAVSNRCACAFICHLMNSISVSIQKSHFLPSHPQARSIFSLLHSNPGRQTVHRNLHLQASV